MRQIWIDRTGTITKKCRKMMYLPRFTSFQNNRHRCSLLRTDQMLLQSGQRQQGWHCNMILIDSPVRKDQDVRAFSDRTVYFNEQIINSFFQTGILIIYCWNLCHFESILLHILYLQKICIGKNWIIYLQHLTILFFFFQKIAI